MQYPNYENLKIGSQMYAVHSKYPDEKLNGGKIIVCRVKSFEQRKNRILPILTEKGNSKREIDPTSHYIYTNLSDAIDAIRGTYV